jgi:plasmid maintenance system killer protein
MRLFLAGRSAALVEKPAANRAGQYSIRTNDQWRICFTGDHDHLLAAPKILLSSCVKRMKGLAVAEVCD